MFDRLVLLASGGREVYVGPVGAEGADVLRYFLDAPLDETQFQRPQLSDHSKDVNVASFIMELIGAGTSSKGRVAAYDQIYAQSHLRQQNAALLQELSTPKECGRQQQHASFAHLYAASYLTQLDAVVSRLSTAYWRDTSYNSVKFFLMSFLGVLFGLVYLQIGDGDQPGLVSKLSIIYMGAGFMSVLQASNALPVVYKMRQAFYRERAANTYAPWIYSTAMGVVELPWLLACTILFTLPFYFLVGFVAEADKFFHYLLVKRTTHNGGASAPATVLQRRLDGWLVGWLLLFPLVLVLTLLC